MEVSRWGFRSLLVDCKPGSLSVITKFVFMLFISCFIDSFSPSSVLRSSDERKPVTRSLEQLKEYQIKLEELIIARA